MNFNDIDNPEMKKRISVLEARQAIRRFFHDLATPFWNIKHWYLNGFVTRTHAVPTNVPFGQWRDADTRMLYACMNLLVDFVEDEVGLDEMKYKGENDVVLDKETQDTLDESLKRQVHNNKELLAIYEWWMGYRETEERLSQFYQMNEVDREIEMVEEELREMRDKMERLEEQEEEMLVRLMKVRGSMWT